MKDGAYRRELYEKALDAIRQTNWGGRSACLIVCDDASRNPPERPQVGILSNLLVSPVHLGAHQNTKRAIQEAIKVAEWVLVFDSDAVVRPDWVYKTFEMVEKFPAAPGYGLFNSRFHKTVGEDGEYVFKDHPGGCGFLFRAEKYVPACDDCPWEECSTFMRVVHGGQFVLPRRSIMNHLGNYGLSNNGTLNDTDPTF